MRGHKYIRRTGSPGNYRYWYKLPSGEVVEGDASQQDHGKNDHARRLLAAKAAGKHEKSIDEMAAEIGISPKRLREHMSNMRQKGRAKTGATGTTHEGKDVLHHGHDYTEEHLAEAVGSGGATTAAASEPAAAAAAPAPARRPRRPRAATPAPAAAGPEDELKKLRERLASEHGVRLPTTAAPAAAPAAPASASREKLSRARAAVSAPEAREVAELSPAFARGEEDLREMIENQAAGTNPYLKRALKIYNKISSDLKPERKETASHALAALAAVSAGNTSWPTSVDESALLAKYKEISGSTRVRTFPWDEFEKATFHSKDEILKNPEVDVELERVKRGYARKQFARALPFLKDGWKTANPSAPPPMPTFGDFKSWSDHASKPSWAGTTRLAVPKEIFDAAVKKDGKPLYPPAWMPIHLMPVWNYVAKKEDSAYAARKPGEQQVAPSGELALGSQASYQEGVIIAALRKYVQMRGANQLVDIPKLKLEEAGLTHADIFKAEGEVSDARLKQIVLHKIVDPVELLKVVKTVMKEKKSTKKSLTLYVDETPKSEGFYLKEERFYV